MAGAPLANLPRLSELWSLADRVAVVTGGARGIGHATALRLAEAGAHVAIVDCDERGAYDAAAAIRAAGSSAEAFALDVADGAAVAAAFERLGATRGRIDVLVNNAGVFPLRPFLDGDDAVWRRGFDVNVLGAVHCVRAAVPHMRKAGGGVVVNLASIGALHPQVDFAHYDASKGAVVAMTRSLAWELRALDIRVNAVAPGGVQTPGAEEALAPLMAEPERLMARVNEFAARVATRRFGEPDEVARAVLFLATPMSSYMTGAVVVVDGGFLLS